MLWWLTQPAIYSLLPGFFCAATGRSGNVHRGSLPVLISPLTQEAVTGFKTALSGEGPCVLERLWRRVEEDPMPGPYLRGGGEVSVRERKSRFFGCFP
jgi:hypothetical protein